MTSPPCCQCTTGNALRLPPSCLEKVGLAALGGRLRPSFGAHAPSTLLAQGLWVRGLAAAAWAESQGEHWPRTAQPGDPEHPEGSRKGGPSAE